MNDESKKTKNECVGIHHSSFIIHHYFDFFWKKRFGVAAAHNDFANDGAADVRKCGLGNQKNGLDAVAHDVIDLGNRFFVVEIGGVPQAAQQIVCANFFAIMGSQVFKTVHLDFWVFFENLPNPLQSLVERKKVFFRRIDADSNDYFIKKWQRTHDQIDMAGSDWVERTGKNSNF